MRRPHRWYGPEGETRPPVANIAALRPLASVAQTQVSGIRGARARRCTLLGLSSRRPGHRVPERGARPCRQEDSLSTDLSRRLRFALALIMGAEALTVTRDVCSLQAEGAVQVMRWTATALMQETLAT